jgi:hypothetical protein
VSDEEIQILPLQPGDRLEVGSDYWTLDKSGRPPVAEPVDPSWERGPYVAGDDT